MDFQKPDDMPDDTNVLGLYAYGSPTKPRLEWTIVKKHGPTQCIELGDATAMCECNQWCLGVLVGWLPLPEVEVVP